MNALDKGYYFFFLSFQSRLLVQLFGRHWFFGGRSARASQHMKSSSTWKRRWRLCQDAWIPTWSRCHRYLLALHPLQQSYHCTQSLGGGKYIYFSGKYMKCILNNDIHHWKFDFFQILSMDKIYKYSFKGFRHWPLPWMSIAAVQWDFQVKPLQSIMNTVLWTTNIKVKNDSGSSSQNFIRTLTIELISRSFYRKYQAAVSVP